MTHGAEAVIPTGDYLYPPRFEAAPGGGMIKLTGITRRDWLAGLAMQAIISNNELLEKHEIMALEMANNDRTLAQTLVMDNISKASHAQADAMIAEGLK